MGGVVRDLAETEQNDGKRKEKENWRVSKPNNLTKECILNGNKGATGSWRTSTV